MTKPGEKSPYLAGRLLLAMPAMGDPRFQKAVIFMCAHDENGAMGLVINHILPGVHLGQLMEQINIGPAPENQAKTPVQVFCGGPVETARGFILHSNDFRLSDTVAINSDIFVTGTVDALKAVASGAGPQQMRFILGYAGWSAGQLDHEIQQNAWLIVDADRDLIFTADPEKIWDQAIKKIGIDPMMLSSTAGRA